MPEKYRRNFLKEKETRMFLERATNAIGTDIEKLLPQKTNIEIVEAQDLKLYLANGRAILTEIKGRLIPTLLFGEFLSVAPKVVVDMGAVPFVCKGANIMRPGIRRFEGQFNKGSIVFVADEKHGKPLALGIAILERNEADKTTQGPIIQNLHYVGDATWNSIRKLHLTTP